MFAKGSVIWKILIYQVLPCFHWHTSGSKVSIAVVSQTAFCKAVSFSCTSKRLLVLYRIQLQSRVTANRSFLDSQNKKTEEQGEMEKQDK